MARPLRVLFGGAWYHVMNRGGSRRPVFPTPVDRADFLDLFGEITERYRLEIHAYCLMGNHYHALLRTAQPNLPDAMRHLDSVFTQRFHRRHGTDGALFRGRYRAVLVQANRYMLHVSRYIHLNPVEAALARRAEDWPFSSYRGYLDPRLAPPWLETSVILGSFGSIGSRHAYRRFVEAGLDPGTRDFFGRPRLRPVLGDDAFRDEIRGRARSLPDAARRELPDLRHLTEKVPLAAIARVAAEIFGVPVRSDEAVAVGTRTRVSLARGAFVHAARRLGGWRLHEIGAWLGYRSYDAPARAAERFAAAAAQDPELAKLLADMVARFEAVPDGASRGPETDFKSNVET